MRRLALVSGMVLALLTVSTPAYAFAHNRVANPYLHAALDLLIVALAMAPVLAVYFWSRKRRTTLTR